MLNRYQKSTVPTYGFELFGGSRANDPITSELDEIHSNILSSVQGMDDASYSNFISKGGLKKELGSLMAAINKRFGLNCVIGAETGLSDKPVFSNFYVPFNLGNLFKSVFNDKKEIDQKVISENYAALNSKFGGSVDHINGTCKGIDNSESYIMLSYNKLASLGVSARECTALLMQEISGLFSVSDFCSRFSKGFTVITELADAFRKGLTTVKKACLYKLATFRLIDDADVKDLNEETNGLFFTGKLLGAFIRRFKAVVYGLNPFSEAGKSINFVNMFGLTDAFKNGFNKVANMMGISTESDGVDTIFGRLAKAIVVYVRHLLLSVLVSWIGFFLLIIPPIGIIVLALSGLIHFVGIIKAILVLLTGNDDLTLFSEHSELVNKSKAGVKAKKACIEQSTGLTTSALSKKDASRTEFNIFNKIVTTLGFSDSGTHEEKGALIDLGNLSKSSIFKSVKSYIPFVGK